MTLPKSYTNQNPTNCCPVFDPKPWDEKEIEFKNKLFIKDKTFNFLHIPINMKQVIERSWKKIKKAKADPKTEDWLLLSYDPSPWKGEHYFSVTKEVPNAINVELSGTFLTKVFEGPYKDAAKWVQLTEKYIKSKKKKLKKLYFFYTTCPKCAKHYGKNYTIAFAQID